MNEQPFEPVTKPCEVCGDDVVLDVNAGDVPALCILHWFSEDPTQPWEADE